ncbi:serine-threonine/tyrosine-protein kinase catalytic domain-containing protein [Tanacetum coccineum]
MDVVAKELEETLNVQVEHELEENDVEYWEKKLPDKYDRYTDMSDIPLNTTSKKELYLLFCRGFLSNNGQLWFSTCNSTRRICSILSPTHVLSKDPCYEDLETLSLPESRFKEVKKLGNRDYYEFTCRLESFMFSPDHYNYAYYLVFKLKEGHVMSTIVSFFQASWILGGKDGTMYNTVHFLGGDAVTIPIRPKNPKEESGSSKSIDGGPGMSKQYYVDSSTSCIEKRDDGWLEARLTKPLLKHDLENHKELVIHLYALKKEEIGWSLNAMIVEGVEFRPVVVDNKGRILASVEVEVEVETVIGPFGFRIVIVKVEIVAIGELVGVKLENGLLKLANWYGFWYVVPNDGSWLMFELLSMKSLQVGSSRTLNPINRDRDDAEERLMTDYFGANVGANNDLTVVNNSPVFENLLNDIAPIAPFEVNGFGFYPQWVIFVKSFTVARDKKNSLFKRRQEGARNDIERAFVVL